MLDLDGHDPSTARNAGWLDIKIVPELHNAVKVLLFLDVGGSMDDHIKPVEELFRAARAEFKNLEHFYFHNCVYESVWKDNRRRHGERIPTVDVLRKYGHDWKLILVGDAAMSPYELEQPGGSVEHWNDEPGRAWLERLRTGVAARGVAEPRAARSTGAGPPPPRTSGACWRGACDPVTLGGLERPR